MDEGMSTVARGQQHIIERPRLTKLLDESNARIILLVAPAGYGKTTLAREWMQGRRRHAWYGASRASADLAALAVGLEYTIGLLDPNQRPVLSELLRSGVPARSDPRLLVEIALEELENFPSDAWIAIDDYHLVSPSELAQSFVEEFVARSPTGFVITSREKPSWITARQIVYGHVLEVGTADLAMTDDEVARLLAGRETNEIKRLAALARGWPALLGLAATLDRAPQSQGRTSERHYEFFAEELFKDVPGSLEVALLRLSVAPTLDKRIVDAIGVSDQVLNEAEGRGFLRRDAGSYSMHPLLRHFLHRKLQEREDAEAIPASVAGELLAGEAWDDAFEIIETFGVAELLERLITEGMGAQLREGRVETVSRWHAAAKAAALISPSLELLEAELEARKGNHAMAHELAEHIAQTIGSQHPLYCRALLAAARAGYLADKSTRAERLFHEASRVATTNEERREALLGAISTGLELEVEDFGETLRALTALEETQDADTVLRTATARLIYAGHRGGIRDALLIGRRAAHMAAHSNDPLVRSSFFNIYSLVCSLACDYTTGVEVARIGLEDAEAARLVFGIPHLQLRWAAAETGLRNFSAASHLLLQVAISAPGQSDPYLVVAGLTLRVRLLVSQRLYDEALDVAGERLPPLQSPIMSGEWAASKALAFACAGHAGEGRALADEADVRTRSIEARVIAQGARAVASMITGINLEHETAQLLKLSIESGNADGLLCVLRGCPDLIETLGRDPDARQAVSEMLGPVLDPHLADRAGFGDAGTPRRKGHLQLSPREAEVLGLVAQGLPNRQIAKALFISEVTVKVHVRNVLRKLGVRSRTEAAVRAIRVGFPLQEE